MQQSLSVECRTRVQGAPRGLLPSKSGPGKLSGEVPRRRRQIWYLRLSGWDDVCMRAVPEQAVPEWTGLGVRRPTYNEWLPTHYSQCGYTMPAAGTDLLVWGTLP